MTLAQLADTALRGEGNARIDAAGQIAARVSTDVKGKIEAIREVTDTIAQEAGVPAPLVTFAMVLGGVVPVLALIYGVMCRIYTAGTAASRRRAQNRREMAEAAARKLHLNRALESVRQMRHRQGSTIQPAGRKASYLPLSEVEERPEL